MGGSQRRCRERDAVHALRAARASRPRDVPRPRYLLRSRRSQRGRGARGARHRREPSASIGVGVLGRRAVACLQAVRRCIARDRRRLARRHGWLDEKWHRAPNDRLRLECAYDRARDRVAVDPRACRRTAAPAAKRRSPRDRPPHGAVGGRPLASGDGMCAVAGGRGDHRRPGVRGRDVTRPHESGPAVRHPASGREHLSPVL